MFSSSGQQFNQFDASNMLGGMLARSMRLVHGDPFGGAVREALPTFQDRYDHHRQRELDRAGGMPQAIARLRQQGGYGGTSDYLKGLVPGSRPKTDDELAQLLEDRWRNRADTDVKNYDLWESRELRAQRNKPSWMYY